MIGKGMVSEIGDLANFSSNIKSKNVWFVTRISLLLEFTLQRANDFICTINRELVCPVWASSDQIEMIVKNDKKRSETQGGSREASLKEVCGKGTTVGTRSGSEAAKRAMTVRVNTKSICPIIL